jgi:hypothetical protein
MIKHGRGGELAGDQLSNVRIDQRGARLDAELSQELDEQLRFIFAITESLGQDLLRVVRRHRVLIERHAQVADFILHEAERRQYG